ncbi:DUF1345 domain-containing protein [Telluria mixta]|uniref:DUF1345 domain-containing protein n=1 Tax=Telluria mixta TaxID=34071 RepID=A0ABT2BY25_9BURK|nr:DUF1345 domain-containing protein [Telluria mixta]MCS0630040.1 DUF1345 domain-containing protein [Telluria mixta]WEM96410.1 DUF1345 domain-containing protein [Telluria mixta]
MEERPAHQQPNFLLRFIRSRPYLLGALVLGVAVGILVPERYNELRRALIGWNSGVWAYLLAMAWTMFRADHSRVRAIAEKQDESGGAVLGAVVVGAILSVYAIVTELANMKEASEHMKALHYGFTALTVIGSWLLVGVMYCLHYAHIYYTASKHTLPLEFPDQHTQPNYWDFLYFSFTLSVAVQTSDVTVKTRAMRKLVLGHCVLAFFFNLVILGLSVNIAASLVNT